MWRCKGKTESDVHLYNYEIKRMIHADQQLACMNLG